MSNFRRLMAVPEKSFFLFGPRGTGKSTWLAETVPAKLSIDLLQSELYFRYSANPRALRDATKDLAAGDWVVIDEAQRVPEILNEVHSLYETRGLKFAISGSSARKLKRSNANLLAGRALRYDFFPLVWPEINGQVSIKDCLDWGTLPLVLNEPRFAADTLASYVATYLKEEIATESIVRKLEPFARFLKIAATHHGQQLNVSAVSQQSFVNRRTVDNYFEIIEETLLGSRLPALNLGLYSKEAKHPKFYFFDAGVARGAAGWLREELPDEWRGLSLETLVLLQLKAYNSYHKRDKDIYHYTVNEAFDIDFLVEVKKKILTSQNAFTAFEVKHATRWKPEWSKPMTGLLQSKKSKITAAFGIYLGTETVVDRGVTVLPFDEFCRRLWAGEFF
jgi:uncharacterized protein